MKKRCTVFLTLILISLFLPLYSTKYVIAGRQEVGFFSNFNIMLYHLHYCDTNNLTPVVYWPDGGRYYDERGCNGIISKNVWDYYFYPVSNLTYERGIDKPNSTPIPPHGVWLATEPLHNPLFPNAMYPNKNWRKIINSLINKYIRIKEPILEKINEFKKNNFQNKFIVGIHLRGTDKWREVKAVSPEILFAHANKYAPCTFYVATDDIHLFALAKEKLQGEVIYYDAFRSPDGEGTHYTPSYPQDKSRALLGEEALIECILLSQCNVFIHTWSNLSTTVLFFNPELETIHVDK